MNFRPPEEKRGTGEAVIINVLAEARLDIFLAPPAAITKGKLDSP